jgi:NADH:ubiquinone oxidoreductase subunit 6 (subunit J)
LFYIIAAISIFSAAAVITRMRPLASSCWLALFWISISILFAMLAAPTIASLQLIISSGTIMAFIFTAMKLESLSEPRARIMRFGMVLGAAAAGYLVIVLMLAIIRSPITETPIVGASFEAPTTSSVALMGEYAMAFGALGMLALTCVVATVVLMSGSDDKEEVK